MRARYSSRKTKSPPIIALLARFTRGAVLDIQRQDFVRTGRAKGLSESLVLRRHILKNAMIPVVTVIGLQVGALFSGAVVTETVFSWPGTGLLAIDAVRARDYQVVQAVVIVFSAIFIVTNLLVDILYAYLDPRIRYR